MRMFLTPFTAIILCLLSPVSRAQFTVTKVSGRIKNEMGSIIRPGSELKTNDRLLFSSSRDKLWVIQAGKGERMISPTPQASSENSLLSQLLITALHMDSRSGSLSGRGAMIEKLPDAVQATEGSNHKLLIENRNKYLFDPMNYPQTGGATFFLQIDIPDESPIIRPLRTNGDTLIILYSDFYTETFNSAVQYKLGYYNKDATPSSASISSIDPYFDQTNEMESIISNTITAYKKDAFPKDSISEKAYNNIYYNLGKPDYFLFNELFAKLWLDQSDKNDDNDNKMLGAVLNARQFESVPKLSALAAVTRDRLPANFSLRQYAPPVGNQHQYGSCTAWSTAYATRTISYAIHHNYSIHKNYDKIIAYTFAPDFIYNNIRSTTDCYTGTTIYSALEFMKSKGNLVKTAQDFICGQTYSENALANAKNFLIKDFSAVNTLRSTSSQVIEKIKGLLISRNALPFSMHVPNSFKHVSSSGIWYPTTAELLNADSVRRELAPYVGHAMCIIGFNDSIAGGSFEVMNSWGPRNGNNGFYWINYDDFLDFYAEVYSMNDFETNVEEVVAKVEPPVVQVKPKIDPPVVVAPVVKPKVDPPVVVKKIDPPVIARKEVVITKKEVVVPKKEVIVPKKEPVVPKKDVVIVRKKDPENFIIPIKYVMVRPIRDSDNVVIVPKMEDKPKLSGSFEFLVQKPDGSHETIAVERKMVGGRGQDISVDENDPAAFANFSLSKPFMSGTRYRIKFTSSQPSYVYVFGMDNIRTYNLFPQKKFNESALINLSNATLSLPNDSSHYKLDNVPGKEKMCVLLSKSPIDMDLLNQQFSANGHNLYQAVRSNLANRLLEVKSANFSNNKIEFDSKVNDEDVLAFFIEIEHI